MLIEYWSRLQNCSKKGKRGLMVKTGIALLVTIIKNLQILVTTLNLSMR